MRKSLRTRLTIFFVGLAIIPLLILGLVLAQRNFSILSQQAINLQVEVAQRIAKDVRAFLNDRANELLMLIEVQGLTGLDIEDQDALLSTLLASENTYKELSLLKSDGQEDIRISRQEISSEGLVNRSESPEFLSPQMTNEIYYSDVQFDEATGEPFMTIGIPLNDLRSGDFSGVLVADIRFKAVWDLMASAQVPGSGLVYLVDTDNKVVAHRNPGTVLKVTEFVVPDEDGFFQGLENEDAAIATVPVIFGDKTFNIIAELPAAEALSLAVNTTWLTAIVLAISLVVAIVLSAIAARQIVSPIEALATTAEAVSGGDFSKRVHVKNQDEIGILAVAFNHMTDQVQDLVNNLGQRVTDRTRDLELANEIGRNVSEIHSTGQLLSEAVKIIYDEFDLYLVQIYLVEEDQEILLL